ncbi:MAG TPA: hypothetical protein DCR39_04985 [Nitrospiraceae bacterium]|nr:hypothetical protein [Nitrospiraceae bacterium]
MKKFLVVFAAVALSLMVVSSSHAIERKYGTAGCGLGSMLLGDEPGMVQILAVTLNGIAGNQTFGITSGTLNCEKQANFSSNEILNRFVTLNMDNLAKDIASGRGESLETLAELMNIPAENRTNVYSKLQANFSDIFTSESVEAGDVIDNIVIILNG